MAGAMMAGDLAALVDGAMDGVILLVMPGATMPGAGAGVPAGAVAGAGVILVMATAILDMATAILDMEDITVIIPSPTVTRAEAQCYIMII